jgi:homogentisate 1,2-dioxygenase
MAITNTLSINGTVNLNNQSLLTQGVLTNKLNLSSSNNLGNTQQITGSTWTLINSGSATNLRYFFAANNDVSASIWLTNNTTSASFAFMEPGDTLLIPYSGSIDLYAKTVGAISGSPSWIQYIYVSA